MNYILLFSPMGDKTITGIVTPDGTIGENLGRYLNGVKVYDFASVMASLSTKRSSIATIDIALFPLNQSGFNEAFRALKDRGRPLDQLLLIGDALRFTQPEPL